MSPLQTQYCNGPSLPATHMLDPATHMLDHAVEGLLSLRLKGLKRRCSHTNRNLILARCQARICFVGKLIQWHTYLPSVLDVRLVLFIVQLRWAMLAYEQLKGQWADSLCTAGGNSSMILTLVPFNCSRRHNMK